MNDLVVHLAQFARALRAAGVRVAQGDEVDALQALVRIDLGDPAEVRAALRCALKIRRADVATFEALFARLWSGSAPDQAGAAKRPPAAHHGPTSPRALPWSLSGADAANAAADVEIPEGEQPGASREALLRRKPFERYDERDLAELEPLLARMVEKLATRRSRRLVPTPGRGRPDLRRSFRRALATSGELLSLSRRARPLETPKLVFLCDTSGSMQSHTRFLLAFARALKRVAPSTEVFAFNTELVRITEWLKVGKTDVMLARLASSVPDWLGGTRIGESLDRFVRRHLAELVDQRTIVIIFSDGLDRGNPDLTAGAMRRIHERARRVLWLNPLVGDPRYEPTARGMAAALPFVDRLASAHDLETLGRLVPELTV